MMGYFTILAAIPGFFLSALILMALRGVIAPDFGIEKIAYPMAMLITITLCWRWHLWQRRLAENEGNYTILGQKWSIL